MRKKTVYIAHTTGLDDRVNPRHAGTLRSFYRRKELLKRLNQQTQQIATDPVYFTKDNKMIFPAGSVFDASNDTLLWAGHKEIPKKDLLAHLIRHDYVSTIFLPEEEPSSDLATMLEAKGYTTQVYHVAAAEAQQRVQLPIPKSYLRSTNLVKN